MHQRLVVGDRGHRHIRIFRRLLLAPQAQPVRGWRRHFVHPSLARVGGGVHKVIETAARGAVRLRAYSIIDGRPLFDDGCLGRAPRRLSQIRSGVADARRWSDEGVVLVRRAPDRGFLEGIRSLQSQAERGNFRLGLLLLLHNHIARSSGLRELLLQPRHRRVVRLHQAPELLAVSQIRRRRRKGCLLHFRHPHLKALAVRNCGPVLLLDDPLFLADNLHVALAPRKLLRLPVQCRHRALLLLLSHLASPREIIAHAA